MKEDELKAAVGGVVAELKQRNFHLELADTNPRIWTFLAEQEKLKSAEGEEASKLINEFRSWDDKTATKIEKNKVKVSSYRSFERVDCVEV